jgi:hypothetical protein
MPTLVQLSDATILNLDTVHLLRRVNGTWRVWLSEASEPLALTEAETAVLTRYLHNHTTRRAFYEVQHGW